MEIIILFYVFYILYNNYNNINNNKDIPDITNEDSDMIMGKISDLDRFDQYLKNYISTNNNKTEFDLFI